MSDEILKQRTNQQSKSLHLFCKLLADSLNEAGLDMRKVLKPSYQIPWTKNSVKEHIWHPLQEAMYGTNSTIFLHKQGQIDNIHKTIMQMLGEKWGLEHIEFPHDPERQTQKAQGIDMPVMK